MLQSRKAKNSRAKARNQLRGVAASHPPQIQPQLSHRQRMRFRCTTAQTLFPVTYADLLDTIFFADTAVTGFDVFDQVKLNAVELWAVPAIGGTAEVAVQFEGGFGGGPIGDGRVFSDSSMGIEPAHVVARPERLSTAAMWTPSNAGFTAFALSCPAGAIIDVDLSFRTVASLAPVALQQAVAAGTVGEMYYRGLDGAPIATTVFVPLAPTTR